MHILTEKWMFWEMYIEWERAKKEQFLKPTKKTVNILKKSEWNCHQLEVDKS